MGGSGRNATRKMIRSEQNHMATTFDLRISCSSDPGDRAALAERTLAACQLEVERLENELSEFLEASPIYRLNQAAPFEKVTFTADAIALLIRSMSLRELTNGSFDPLAKSKDLPQDNLGLGWDPSSRQVWRLSEKSHLGFGAIGKGYAIDCVRKMIEEAGFEAYVLSAGGSSIALSGEEAPGSPWKWGWSWKKNEAGENLGVSLVHQSGKKISLGVSGTHEKGEHLIDRRSHAAQSTLKSAVIATSSTADADALSTALFLSGWENSKKYLERLPLAPAAAWIDAEETPHWNGIFSKLWPSFCFVFLFFQTNARADESVDLNSIAEPVHSFNPYIFDRNSYWILLPLFCFAAVILHLKKNKTVRERKKQMKRNASALLVATLLWGSAEMAQAVELEPMGKAVAALLGTTKAFKKTLGDTPVFYAKGPDGKATKVVFIQKGIYQPDCTHTWAISLDAATQTVSEVRPLEMSCPHAFPARAASFLDQYKGVGPANVAALDSNVHVVAKATGTCRLTTDAVKRSIQTLVKSKGEL